MTTKVKFSVAGEKEMPVYEAVDIHPERWNGWLRPIVTIETAMQIADDLFDAELNNNEAHDFIWDCITEAKENHEDTVEVGGFIIWDEVGE